MPRTGPLGPRVRLAAALLAVVIASSDSGRGTSPTVRIVHPVDGAVVSSPLTVMVTADDVRLAPCTDPDPCGGHVTILVDRPCPAAGEVVPSGSLRAADVGVHGLTDGGTVLILSLPPGRHTLCAQLTDGLRVAFGATHAVTVVVDRAEVLPWRQADLRTSSAAARAAPDHSGP